jgi:hypothetical protein
MNFYNKQEISMNFYNKQEYSMNLCNFEQFLKLSRINKYLLRVSLLNKNFLWISRISNKFFYEFLEQTSIYYKFSWINKVKIFLLTCGWTMLVHGGAMWENDRGWREVTCLRRRGSRRLQKYQTNEIVY